MYSLQNNHLDEVRIKAFRLLLLLSGLIVLSVAIRSYVQESYPTIFGLVCLWSILLATYQIRTHLDTNIMIWLVVIILVIGQAFVLYKLGLLSGGPYLLMFTAAFAGLLRDKRQRFAALFLTIFPLAYFTCRVLLELPVPSLEVAGEYAQQKSTWLTLTITAAVMSTMLVQISSWLVDSLEIDRNNYRNSLYFSLEQLSLLRDHETGEHIQRCAEFSTTLLSECVRNKYEKSAEIAPENLFFATKLHDIGKVGVSDAILRKPGKLTPDEFIQMQTHTTLGAEIISKIAETNHVNDDPVLVLGAEIAKHHHENWDGTGYPDGASVGLIGKNISLESRIMAIADVYDALRSDRPYKQPYNHAQTVEIMRGMVGKKFDPALFNFFLNVADQFETIYSSTSDKKRFVHLAN